MFLVLPHEYTCLGASSVELEKTSDPIILTTLRVQQTLEGLLEIDTTKIFRVEQILRVFSQLGTG